MVKLLTPTDTSQATLGYLLADGTIPLTGDWDVGAFNIKHEDSKGTFYGTGDDAFILFNGTDLVINHPSSGVLRIDNDTAGQGTLRLLTIQDSSGNQHVSFSDSGPTSSWSQSISITAGVAISSSNTLTFGSGGTTSAFGVTDGMLIKGFVVLNIKSANDTSSAATLKISGPDRTSPADNDQTLISFWHDDDDGTQRGFSEFRHKATDLTNSTKDSQFEFAVMSNNTLTDALILAGTVATFGSGVDVRLNSHVGQGLAPSTTIGYSYAETFADSVGTVITGWNLAPTYNLTENRSSAVISAFAGTQEQTGNFTVGTMLGLNFQMRQTISGAFATSTTTSMFAMRTVLNYGGGSLFGTHAGTDHGSYVIETPVLEGTGALSITNMFGILIRNQGFSGITTSAGIKILAQSGATNNFHLVTEGVGGVVFNEDGANTDLRAEGDTIDDVLFVDASADELISTSRGVLRYAYLMG